MLSFLFLLFLLSLSNAIVALFLRLSKLFTSIEILGTVFIATVGGLRWRPLRSHCSRRSVFDRLPDLTMNILATRVALVTLFFSPFSYDFERK